MNRNMMGWSLVIAWAAVTSIVGVSALVNSANTESINTNGTIILSPKSTAVAQVGTDVTVNCSYTEPLPSDASIRWYQGPHRVPTRNIRSFNDHTIVQLLLSDVQVEDADPGYYTCCLVYEEEGRCRSKTETHIRLKVGYPPEPAENLKCFAHDVYYGQCTWSTSESYLETNHILQEKLHNEHADVPWRQVDCINKTAAQTSCRWKESKDKTRVYRVMSENDLGKNVSDLSDEFHVLHNAVPLPPSDIELRKPTTHSIQVEWPHQSTLLPGKPDFYLHILKYKLRYKTNFHPEWSSYQPVIDIVPNIMKIAITHLDPPYANVCVQIAAQNKIKPTKLWSAWSQITCSHLEEDRPAVAPRMTAKERNQEKNKKLKDVDLIWDPIPERQRNGEILGYNITVTGRYKGDTINSFTHSTNATNFQMLDLNRTYDYNIKLVAYNSRGISPAANHTITSEVAGKMRMTVFIPLFAVTALLLVVLITYCFWRKVNKPTHKIVIPEIVSRTTNNPNFRLHEPEEFDEIRPGKPQLNVHVPESNHNFGAPISSYENSPDIVWSDDPVSAPLLHRAAQNDTTDKLHSAVTQLLAASNNEEPNSPRSVNSGGSYLGDDIVYKRMTPQGLSPIDKNFPGNPQWDHIILNIGPDGDGLQNDDSTTDEDNSSIAMYARQGVAPVATISGSGGDLSAQNSTTPSGNSSIASSQEHIDAYVKQGNASPSTPRITAHTRTQSHDLNVEGATPSGGSSRASSQESDINNIDPYVKQSGALMGSPTGASHKRTRSYDPSLTLLDTPSMLGQNGSATSDQNRSVSDNDVNVSTKPSKTIGVTPPQTCSHENLHDQQLHMPMESANSSRTSSQESGLSDIEPYAKQSGVLPGTPRMNAHRKTNSHDLAAHHLGSNSRAGSQNSVGSNDSYVRQSQVPPSGTPKMTTHRKTISPAVHHSDALSGSSNQNGSQNSIGSNDGYVKQSRLPCATPRMNSHSRANSHDLSQRHLDIPSGSVSKTSSQESGISNTSNNIDPYVKQGEVPAFVSLQQLQNVSNSGVNSSQETRHNSSLQDNQPESKTDNEISNYVQSAAPSTQNITITDNPLSAIEQLSQLQNDRQSPVADYVRQSQVPVITMTNGHNNSDSGLPDSGWSCNAVAGNETETDNSPIPDYVKSGGAISARETMSSTATQSVNLPETGHDAVAFKADGAETSAADLGYSKLTAGGPSTHNQTDDETLPSDAIKTSEDINSEVLPAVASDFKGSQSESAPTVPDGSGYVGRKSSKSLTLDADPIYIPSTRSDDGYSTSSQANSTPPDSPGTCDNNNMNIPPKDVLQIETSKTEMVNSMPVLPNRSNDYVDCSHIV